MHSVNGDAAQFDISLRFLTHAPRRDVVFSAMPMSSAKPKQQQARTLDAQPDVRMVNPLRIHHADQAPLDVDISLRNIQFDIRNRNRSTSFFDRSTPATSFQHPYLPSLIDRHPQHPFDIFGCHS